MLGTRLRGRELQWLPYASLRWYADPPATPLTASGHSRRHDRTRAARVRCHVRHVVPLKLGRLDLPALGFGYRFGENLSVFRLVIGQPF